MADETTAENPTDQPPVAAEEPKGEELPVWDPVADAAKAKADSKKKAKPRKKSG